MTRLVKSAMPWAILWAALYIITKKELKMLTGLHNIAMPLASYMANAIWDAAMSGLTEQKDTKRERLD